MAENKQDNKCQLCGESMPVGEDMFNYHGYSGPCPKPPLRHTENDYVAWVHYHNGSISTCDSDAPEAFKVYRYSAVVAARKEGFAAGSEMAEDKLARHVRGAQRDTLAEAMRVTLDALRTLEPSEPNE